MSMKMFLVKIVLHMFSTHFPTYWLHVQVIKYMCYFLKILEDKNLPFKKAKKAYILKFKCTKLATMLNFWDNVLE